MGDKIRNGFLTAAISGPQVGGNATSPLHSRGFPKMGIKSEMTTSPVPSRGKCYITLAFPGNPKQRRTKSEVATSRLPSRGPTSGWKCNLTHTFSGAHE